MKQETGYTLIELIVVICVLALMLGFTLPKVQDVVMSDPFEKTSRQWVILIRSLKQAAVADQKTYTLHIDTSRNRFWETDDTLSEEQIAAAEEKATRLPAGIGFSKVTFLGNRAVSTGVVAIRFYPKGYSDGVEMLIEDNQRHRRTFIVEPFLSEVRITGEG